MVSSLFVLINAMGATQMELEGVLVLVNAITVFTLYALLILMLRFNVARYACFVYRAVTVRALHMGRVLAT